MAARKLSLSKLLLRRHHTLRPISSPPSNPTPPYSSPNPHYSHNTPHRYLPTHAFYRHSDGDRSFTPHKLSPASFCYRSFSTNRENSNEIDGPEGEELLEQGLFDYDHGAAVDLGEVVDAAGAGAGTGEEPILPVRGLIWFLDGVHDLTGMPWWMVIITGTLALRVAVLPVLLVQLRELNRIAEFAPQLPPPFPKPFSGTSWIEQYKRFQEKRKALNCPSLLWVLAYPSVQIPFFILGTSSVRRMALDHHPGFESGGTLWFQNLTEFSHGASGYIFPLLIASLHILHTQVALSKSSWKRMPSTISLLAKYYKYYLQLLSFPILYTGFFLPQGSLLYWSANSILSVTQHLVLRHPNVREKIGLSDKLAPKDSGNPQQLDGLEATFTVPLVKKPIQDLSLLELFNLSIKHLSKGEQDRAVLLLRLALEKDPEYVRALIVMGQLLMKEEKLVEATQYLERAIANLLLSGHPKEVEEIDHLILASLWSGVAYAKQGKVSEGIVHLERIANMKEPEDTKSKTHYCDGLFMLSSALASIGRNAEAAKYLRILTTYDPAYGAYLKDVETGGEDKFMDDLVNSRRKDY